MKTLKTTLLILAVALTTLTSCKKEVLTPINQNTGHGQINYFVTSFDEASRNAEKHITYGYDNFVKDTVVTGDFAVNLSILASNDVKDYKSIFIKCESSSNEGVVVRVGYSQFLEYSGKFNFNCYSSGACNTMVRESKDKLIVLPE